MEFNDKNMKAATQVAYLHVLEKAVDNLLADGRKGPFSIRELILTSIDIDHETRKYLLNNRDDMDKFQSTICNSDLCEDDKTVIGLFDKSILDWKIADIHDMNDINGLYACTIQTSEKQAIVAFRGSENFHKYKNFKDDWVKANFGILNSTATIQDKEAVNYADFLIENKVLDKYDKIAVTGHSLGGHLASSFTIGCADPSRAELFDKIEKSINFDGPGYSEEYIADNDEKIKKAAPKMSHYKWSLVGNLMFDVPGENVEVLKIDQKQHWASLWDRLKYKVVVRHDTRSIMFDDDGMAERGKHVDIASGFMGSLSRSVDRTLSPETTHDMYLAGAWIFKHLCYEKEDGTIGIKSPDIISTGDLPYADIMKDSLKKLECSADILKDEWNQEKNGKAGFLDVCFATEDDAQYSAGGINKFVSYVNKHIDRGQEVVPQL